MKFNYLLLLVVAALLPWATGCPKPPGPTTEAEHEDHDGEEHEGVEADGHAHADGDVLFWHREDLDHEGYIIKLGQHGPRLYAGHVSEPAVDVTKDGQPVADAKVFVTLLDQTGKIVLTEEAATIYEPTTPEEPAHYAQAEVKVPKEAKNVTLRYRIEIPGASEFTQDVAVATEAH